MHCCDLYSAVDALLFWIYFTGESSEYSKRWLEFDGKVLHQRTIRPQSNTGQSSGSTPSTCFDLHHMGAVHGEHRRDKSPQSSLQRTWAHYWPTFLVEHRPKTTDMANKNCEVHINILFLIRCSDFHESIFKWVPAQFASIALHQGGITCGAIDEPRISSKAIDERVMINFRDKNVVIARFRDKNVYR